MIQVARATTKRWYGLAPRAQMNPGTGSVCFGNSCDPMIHCGQSFFCLPQAAFLATMSITRPLNHCARDRHALFSDLSLLPGEISAFRQKAGSKCALSGVRQLFHGGAAGRGNAASGNAGSAGVGGQEKSCGIGAAGCVLGFLATLDDRKTKDVVWLFLGG